MLLCAPPLMPPENGLEQETVKIVVGLGNPGARYARTRHNLGFDAVDLFASRQGWAWNGRRMRAALAEGVSAGEKVLLAKPQTYMNDSGLAVGELVRFYKLDLGSLLVVCDDLDLPLGRVRLRARGAAGGQHGLESIIQHLGGDTRFARLRIGVGRPTQGREQNIDFLLSRPTADERIELDLACERAADAIAVYLAEGVEAAMNRFNADGTNSTNGEQGTNGATGTPPAKRSTRVAAPIAPAAANDADR
jgi:PTH1 family peptidyl-tRNA hydrolase